MHIDLYVTHFISNVITDKDTGNCNDSKYLLSGKMHCSLFSLYWGFFLSTNTFFLNFTLYIESYLMLEFLNRDTCVISQY